MKEVEKIMKTLKENKPILERKIQSQNSWSLWFIRQRRTEEKSVILDILVEFQKPLGLFEFMELEDFT